MKKPKTTTSPLLGGWPLQPTAKRPAYTGILASAQINRWVFAIAAGEKTICGLWQPELAALE